MFRACFFLHLEYKQLRIFFIKSRFCGENHSFFLFSMPTELGIRLNQKGAVKKKHCIQYCNGQALRILGNH